jgi:hypothetical protein
MRQFPTVDTRDQPRHCSREQSAEYRDYPKEYNVALFLGGSIRRDTTHYTQKK